MYVGREQLPAWSAKGTLVEAVRDHGILLIVGETGSGKTTQIPQYLYEAGFGKHGIIACTQPRRVAATTIATRVSQEMGSELGALVGYSVRFDDCTSPETRVKYMTDGMLLREALVDPLLHKYKVVILDEAHERTVATDVLLGLLKGLQAKRGLDFRLIIMSATIVTKSFMDYFPGCVAAYIQGRQHNVDVLYTVKPQDSYLDAALGAVLQIHASEPAGDILVFLTGQEEIESCQRLLQERVKLLAETGADFLPLFVLPIYAALPHDLQMRIFQPATNDTRKVILATNIAETSVTIPGIRFVVDTGVVKARAYSAKLGVDCLQVTTISKAQARQRSGRAGRESDGKAFRLYTEDTFAEMPAVQEPEIKRCNLGSVLLQLKGMGIQDPLSFDFLDKPPQFALLRGLELLLALGALDTSGNLTTTLGRPLSRLPVDPMYGCAILASVKLGCAADVCAIVSMISTDMSVFIYNNTTKDEASASHKQFVSKHGDHLTLLAAFQAFTRISKKEQRRWSQSNFCNYRALEKAEAIYKQLVEHLTRKNMPVVGCSTDSKQDILKCLVAGLFPHAACRLPDGTYKLIASGQIFAIHPSSVLHHNQAASYIIFNELVRTSRTYARCVSVIDAAWLQTMAPSYFRVALST